MGNSCSCCCCGCCVSETQDAYINTLTGKDILNGPKSCFCINPCYTYRKVDCTELKLNQYALVSNSKDPR